MLTRLKELLGGEHLSAFLVGGYLRDSLRSRSPERDLDIAVAGDSQTIGRELARQLGGTFVPLNPADLGGNDIQAYNAFNTKPDAKGNVTFTFSKADPKDGTYWMPVTDAGYYLIFRYYAPTSKLNGNTAKDLVYGGTPLEKKFETVKF